MNGLEWSVESMEAADISQLDEKSVASALGRSHTF